MCAAIENPASCEVRRVIRFLLAKNHRLVKIYRQLCEVYRNNVMSKGGVCQWYIKFKNEQTNVYDEEECGGPSIENDKLVENFNEEIRKNHRFTMMDLSLCFPHISQTFLYEIIIQYECKKS